jgi:hypothetical protein
LEARRSLAALAALLALALVVYWRPIVDGFVLLGFDPFVYFYPLMSYRDARLRGLDVPLWVPEYFAGAPFLANPQTGVLYPPNWLTVWLDAPRAYVWQAFGHSAWLAAGGFVVARRVFGVGALAALAAGVVLGFGGYGQSLVSHLNQLQSAAWLPWAVLALSSRRAAALGPVLALQLLAGHAQMSFMTGGLLLVLAALLPHAGGVAPRLGQLAAGGVVAGLLAAPQLLLTLELSGQGIRAGGMSYRDAVAFSLPPWVLPISLLPVYTHEGQPSSEWVGYVGTSGAVLAAVGLVAGPRRVAWLLGGIALAALLLALGQFDPLYPALYRVVPGLSLFRVPARWLFVYSFAVAMLVGLGVQAVVAGGAWRGLLGRVGGVALVVALPFAAYALLVREFPLRWPTAEAVWAWVILAALGSTIVGLGVRGWRWAAPVLVVGLAAELAVASGPMEVNRVGPPEAYSSLRPTEAHLRTLIANAPGGPWRTLAITDSGFDPGDLELLRSQVAGLLPPELAEEWVAAVKHKDTLTPSLSLSFGIPSIDGYDGGVLPLRSYVALKELFPLKAANLNDGRLGIQLDRLPAVDLLSWLNVRWVVMDRHRDLWADGIYYDRAVTTVVPVGGEVVLDGVPARARATSVGGVARPVGGGPAALEVEVAGRDGVVRVGVSLDAGGHPRRLALGGPPRAVERVVLRATGGPVEVSGVTLVDETTGADWPVPAAPGLRFTALGDVKVYENTRALPRAFPVDPDGTVELLSYRPERVELRARLARAGRLVVTDAAYPGWRAEVDGAEAPVLLAEGGMRAVEVGAGEHAVVLRYWPTGLAHGLALSALGLAASLVLWRVAGPTGRT